MTDYNIQEEVLRDAIYKSGFPAYKVYVYGEEISADVMSVRVNQSGGSLERTPSTLSITLANPMEKYTLTHNDMIYVGKTKTSVLDTAAEYLDNIGGNRGAYNESEFGDEYENPIMSGDSTFIDGLATDIFSIPSGDGKTTKKLGISKVRELAMRFATASSEEIMYTLAAEGFADLTAATAEVIASEIKIAKSSHESNPSNEQSFFGKAFSEGDSDIGYNIKREVIWDKLQYYQFTEYPKEEDGEMGFVKEKDGLIFNYPLQEGDCIFNLNDPVRVAFRDPFDTRLWYWSFTGFVDTWTENSGSNLDSTLTITCTDVSKMARYAITAVNPGTSDTNYASNLEQINKLSGSKIGISGILATEKKYAYMTLIDILELTFFGSDSAFGGINSSFEYKLQELAKIEDYTQRVMYAVNQLGIGRDTLDNPKAPRLMSIRELNAKILEEVAGHKGRLQARLEKLKWSGISAPRPFGAKIHENVPFKRASKTNGVMYCVFGEGDAKISDKSYNSVQMSSLWEWNELIHHRVKRSDLEDMRQDSDDGPKVVANKDSLTIEQIIDVIGKKKHEYPVGHGRIFYLTPAGLTEALGHDSVSKAFGGIDSFHSEYKDRLTLIYDLAGEVEWRFYATPKGDLVFEHPFYDLDPDVFFQKGIAENASRSIIEKYDTIFQQQYSGDYSDPSNLTDMVFELNTDNKYLLDYMLDPEFSYENHFTVGIDEQHDFSNTNSDRGLVTTVRVQPNTIPAFGGLESEQKFWVTDTTLLPTLGFRIVDEGSKVHIVGHGEGTRAYCALKLMQRNSEARNLGITTIPKFGLMVNRPLHWKYRNYYCNIVGCSHSVTWNSDAVTTINTNQIRAWSGMSDSDGKPKYFHFGDGGKPFDWARIIKRGYLEDGFEDRLQRKVDEQSPGTHYVGPEGDAVASSVRRYYNGE